MTDLDSDSQGPATIRGEPGRVVRVDESIDPASPQTASGSMARELHLDANERRRLATAITTPTAAAPMRLAHLSQGMPGFVSLFDDKTAHIHLPDNLAAESEYDTLHAIHIDAPIAANFVLFDVDGTLVDSLPAYTELGRQVANAHGLTLGETFVRDTMNRHNEGFWELVVPENEPHRIQMLDSLKQASKKLWPTLIEQMVEPFAGTADCLERLNSCGHRLGIVTASGGGSMSALKKHGLMEFFSTIVTRHDVDRQKPAPDGILKALEHLNTQAIDAIYIGDSLVDVEAARQASVDCVALTSGAGRPRDLARACPRRIIESLDTLPSLMNSHG